MASVCEICAKGELSGNNVSHSHLKTRRTWKPNIQRVRAVSARVACVLVRFSVPFNLRINITKS